MLDATPDGTLGDDAGTDASAEASPPPPTGDAGEACTQPGNVCAPGLFCGGGGTCEVSSCQGKPERSLPYNIATDFNTVFTIGPELDNFTVIPSGADCDSTTYPPIPNTGLGTPGDAGADGAAADAALPTLDDGGVQVVTYPTPPSSCYEILYDPSCQTGLQGLCWAGAVFTNSPATAAAAPGAAVTQKAVGVCLAPAATVISFWARSSVAGSVVKFGSSRPGACAAKPIMAADGGSPDPTGEQTTCPGDTEFYIALTTEWKNYAISLAAGEPTNDEPGSGGGVWNAFSAVVEPEDFIGGAYIFVKDIVWSNPSAGFDAGVGPAEAGVGDAAGAGDEGVASDAPSE
jgi:hypothetical protein